MCCDCPAHHLRNALLDLLRFIFVFCSTQLSLQLLHFYLCSSSVSVNLCVVPSTVRYLCGLFQEAIAVVEPLLVEIAREIIESRVSNPLSSKSGTQPRAPSCVTCVIPALVLESPLGAETPVFSMSPPVACTPSWHKQQHARWHTCFCFHV